MTDQSARLKPCPPENVATHWSRRFLFLYHRCDLIAALLLILILGLYFGLQRLPLQLNVLDDFDFSFALDAVAKARQGVWLGRDVTMTYGPLFQWLYSRIALMRGTSAGDAYLALWMLQFWSIVFLFYTAGALFLRQQAPWKRLFCLMLLVVFWAPVFDALFDMKMLLPMAALGVYLALTRNLPENALGILWRAAMTAALVMTGFLLAADSGVYCVAGLAIILVVRALAARERENLVSLMRFALWSAALGALAALGVNALMGSAFDFHFWRATYENVAQYRWSVNIPMSVPTARRFWATVATALAIFAAEWPRRRRTSSTHDREGTVAFSAMLTFGFVALQSGTVAGERFHVAMSLVPLITFSCYLLMGATQTSPLRPKSGFDPAARKIGARRGPPGLNEAPTDWKSLWPVAIALLLTAAFTGPNHIFIPHNLVAGFEAANVSIPCRARTHELDGICIQESDFQKMTGIIGAVAQSSAPADSVVIFPYQNLYGFFAHRRVAGAVMQNYVEAGEWQTRQQLDSYERERPKLALFFADGTASVLLNHVPNFTREPQAVLYLLRWYQQIGEPAPGVLLLERDPQRAQAMQIVALSMVGQGGSYEVGPGKELEIMRTAVAPDFLRVRLKLEYPFWWRLLKPGRVIFHVRHADGGEKRVPVMVQPDRDYEIWIYPWEDSEIARYFVSDESTWRAPGRAPVTGLSVEFADQDWASISPRRMELAGIDAITLRPR